MLNSEAAAYIAGLTSKENQSDQEPTNVHIMSGTVEEDSADGTVKLIVDGMVFSDDDEQAIEIETMGGLKEGDTATILLTGQAGQGMSPLALSSVGAIDAITTDINGIKTNYVLTEWLQANYADVGSLNANYAHITNGVIDNAKMNYADIDGLEANYARIVNGVIDNASIDVAKVNNLSTTYATIQNLNATNERVGTLEADSAIAKNLIATKADISDLNATNARVETLETDTANVQSLVATKADISDLTATNARVGSIEADYLKAADMDAEQARVGTLLADYTKTSVLEANYAHIKDGVIDNAEIDYADVKNLDAHYAEIDLANVNTAQINNGIIQAASIVDEQVFTVTGNKATISEINADEITVRNLNAKNLKIETADGYVLIGNKKTPTKEFLDSLTNDLQDKIDAAVETYTSNTVPLTTNYPANNWTTDDERLTHVGDICFVVNETLNENGYSYRYAYDSTQQEFKWVLIKDNDVTKALQDITNLESFQSNTESWITETDQGLRSIRENHTQLSGDFTTFQQTTFSELVDEVDEHSSSISQMGTRVDNAEDNLVTLTNTVNNVSQTATENSSSISALTQTVGGHTNTISQHTTKINQNESQIALRATQTEVDGIANRVTAAESAIEINSNNISLKVSQTDYNGGTIASLINQSADTVKIRAQHIELDGTAVFNSISSQVNVAVSDTQMIYYQTEDTIAPSVENLEWISYTSECVTIEEEEEEENLVIRQWSNKPPTYNSSYPITWVAIQKRKLDGSIVTSPAAVDDRMTVIDGGRIIANSVMAESINAESLLAENAAVTVAIGDAINTATENMATTDDIADVQSDLADTTSGLTELINSVSESADQTADSVSELRNWIDIGVNSNDDPALVMGKKNTDGEYDANTPLMQLTNSGLDIGVGDEVFIQMLVEQLEDGSYESFLRIMRAVVMNELRFGDYAWVARSNGNMTLKYVGDDD